MINFTTGLMAKNAELNHSMIVLDTKALKKIMGGSASSYVFAFKYRILGGAKGIWLGPTDQPINSGNVSMQL